MGWPRGRRRATGDVNTSIAATGRDGEGSGTRRGEVWAGTRHVDREAGAGRTDTNRVRPLHRHPGISRDTGPDGRPGGTRNLGPG